MYKKLSVSVRKSELGREHYITWNLFILFILPAKLNRGYIRLNILFGGMGNTKYLHNFCVHIYQKRLRWSRGSVMAFSTQVRGFKPGRSCRIFRAKKSSARLPSEGK